MKIEGDTETRRTTYGADDDGREPLLPKERTGSPTTPPVLPVVIVTDNIDEILEKTGGMGRYQIILQLLSFVIMVTVSHQALDMYFVAADSSWKCVNPHFPSFHNSNISDDVHIQNHRNNSTIHSRYSKDNGIVNDLHNKSVLPAPKSIIGADSTTLKLYTNTSGFCQKNEGNIILQDDALFSERCSLSADEWEFNIPNPESYSIVTEYKLYCGDESTASLAHSSYFIGSSIGSIFVGYLADLYGRKHVFLVLAFLMFLSNMSMYLVTDMWQFILIRVIVGAAGSGCMSTLYVQVFEFMLPQHRAFASNLIQISYGTAIIYLAGVAYFVRRWRNVFLYTTLPCTIAIFSLGIYRSPRWLILKKRYQEAENVFKKLAKFNNREVEIQFSRQVNDDNVLKKEKTQSIIDCFKYKKTATIFFSILLLQYFGGIVYYTMYLEFSRIGGSMYVVIILAALADFPALLIASYFPNKIGRKRFFMVSVVIIALCTLPIVFTPKDYGNVVTVRIASSVAVKVFFSCSADTLIIWTLEVFPTAVRTQGLVLTSMGAKLGSATAPFVVEFLRGVTYVAPFLMIVGLSGLQILLSVLLPETLGKPSRENFVDFFTNDGNGDNENRSPESYIDDVEYQGTQRD